MPDPMWLVWLRYAEDDLQIARLLVRSHPGAAVLHAQQAAEKAVKALWVQSRAADPPRIHHVERLLTELGAAGALVDSAGDLTDGYFTSKYPPAMGGAPAAEISTEDAAERLRSAEEIVQWAKQRLPRG